jgi:hypothetical protein
MYNNNYIGDDAVSAVVSGRQRFELATVSLLVLAFTI